MLCSRPMFMTRGAAFLLLVIHLLLCVHSIDQGTVIKADPHAPSAIVAIWSDGKLSRVGLVKRKNGQGINTLGAHHLLVIV